MFKTVKDFFLGWRSGELITTKGDHALHALPVVGLSEGKFISTDQFNDPKLYVYLKNMPLLIMLSWVRSWQGEIFLMVLASRSQALYWVKSTDVRRV